MKLSYLLPVCSTPGWGGGWLRPWRRRGGRWPWQRRRWQGSHVSISDPLPWKSRKSLEILFSCVCWSSSKPPKFPSKIWIFNIILCIYVFRGKHLDKTIKNNMCFLHSFLWIYVCFSKYKSLVLDDLPSLGHCKLCSFVF